MNYPRQLKPIVILFVLLFSSPFALADSSATLSNAQQAFNAGRHQDAYRTWQALAQAGDSEAQVLTGLAHANGWGVRKDKAAASEWYRRAAENGNASGQFLLGIYLVGKDKASVNNGIDWLRKAAANGETEAQRFLRVAQAKGWFNVADNAKGAKRFDQLAAVDSADF